MTLSRPPTMIETVVGSGWPGAPALGRVWQAASAVTPSAATATAAAVLRRVRDMVVPFCDQRGCLRGSDAGGRGGLGGWAPAQQAAFGGAEDELGQQGEH